MALLAIDQISILTFKQPPCHCTMWRIFGLRKFTNRDLENAQIGDLENFQKLGLRKL
jgi:hypothetical protein